MSDMFDEFRRFEETMNRMFEEIWGISPGRRPLLPSALLPSGERALEKYWPTEARRPFIDVVETDKEVTATAEMPGLEKEDIKINLTEDRLEISAETKQEEEKKEKGYIYKERRAGSYYRAISLPSSIDPENAKASYNNGVLEIKMPKTEIKKKTPIKIE
jgi:HSP20 family protein